MDVINIDSKSGKYQVVLKDISANNTGYIFLKQVNDKAIINESFEILKAYNAQKVFICGDEILEEEKLIPAFSLIEYKGVWDNNKTNKNLKLKALDFTNREAFKNIINEAAKEISGYISLTNADVIEYIKKTANCGVLEIKHEIVGAFLIEADELKYFVIAKEYQRKGYGLDFLQKLLSKQNNPLIAYVASNNVAGLKLIEKARFIKQKKEIKYFQK